MTETSPTRLTPVIWWPPSIRPLGSPRPRHLPQVPWPTWIAHAWGLPPAALVDFGGITTLPDGDVVVVRLDRLPAWVAPTVADHVAVRRGRYATVTGADLRRHTIGADR